MRARPLPPLVRACSCCLLAMPPPVYRALQLLVLSRRCACAADDAGAAAQPRNSPAQAGWVGGKKNKGTHVGLRAAVRSRTRLDVRVGVSGAGTRCEYYSEAGDDAPASVGVHGLQGRELRLMQPMVFLANMSLARHSAPKTRVSARLHVSPRASAP